MGGVEGGRNRRGGRRGPTGAPRRDDGKLPFRFHAQEIPQLLPSSYGFIPGRQGPGLGTAGLDGGQVHFQGGDPTLPELELYSLPQASGQSLGNVRGGP